MGQNSRQSGAAVLISSIIVSAAVLSIMISVMLLNMNSRAANQSFADSLQTYYAAESGVEESMMQLRREHNNFIFSTINVSEIPVDSEFVEIPGACDLPPECSYASDSGWWSERFNYSVNHPDMEVDPYPGPTPTPTEHDWYDDNYKTHEQIDANLMFGSDWFPYDGTQWENREGYGHDYHFGAHWRAKVTATTEGNYQYALGSDDDSWVLVNGIIVINNSGTHAYTIKNGNIFLAAGDNLVEIYFAERHTVASAFSFQFIDQNLTITPWPEGCGQYFECNSHIQSTASTDKATKKVRYTCNQAIENCIWSELIP